MGGSRGDNDSAHPDAGTRDWLRLLDDVWTTAARTSDRGGQADPERDRLLSVAGVSGADRVISEGIRRRMAHELRVIASVMDDGGEPPLSRRDQIRMGILSGREFLGMVQALAAVQPLLLRDLERPGCVFLDVGVGAGGIPLALLRAFPMARVVGLDLDPDLISVAAAVLRQQELTDRVLLECTDVTRWRSREAVDVAWLPVPVLAETDAAPGLAAVVDSLKEGAHVIANFLTGSGGASVGVSRAAMDWRFARWGRCRWHLQDLEREGEKLGLELDHAVIDDGAGIGFALMHLGSSGSGDGQAGSFD